MDCLRDFLRRELGDQTGDLPLSLLISRCYGEILKDARNGLNGRIPPALLQERLRQIAVEFLRSRKGGNP